MLIWITVTDHFAPYCSSRSGVWIEWVIDIRECLDILGVAVKTSHTVQVKQSTSLMWHNYCLFVIVKYFSSESDDDNQVEKQHDKKDKKPSRRVTHSTATPAGSSAKTKQNTTGIVVCSSCYQCIIHIWNINIDLIIHQMFHVLSHVELDTTMKWNILWLNLRNIQGYYSSYIP